MSQPEAYPVQPKPAATHDGHRDDAVVEPAGEGKGMTRSVSQQMLDGLRDATLGPNQRMHQPSVPGRPAKRAEDPEQRPLSFLLSLIAALSVCASVLLVWTTSTEASELPTLLFDVALGRRGPWSAQDNVAGVAALLLSLIYLVVVDFTVCAAVCTDAAGRWFLLHAIGNLVVAALSLPDLFNWWANPGGALSIGYCTELPFPGCSDWPTVLIVAMHIYHMLAFRLSGDDLFHHLLFVPLIGGVNFAYAWGVAGNILSFFISGLPGGVDYLMLAAVKSGRLSSYTEKRVNCSINTWIRGPGITAFCTIVLGAWSQARHAGEAQDLMPPPLFFTACAIIFFNGQFYAQRVIGNYYIRKAQDYTKRGITKVDLHNS